jgi:hypothetical protein
MAAPINVPSAMEVTRVEGVASSGTMLGKRSRERYGMDGIIAQGLVMTITVASNLPRRGESQT